MPTLPLVRGTGTALYPCKRIITFDTSVCVAANGSEQRWARRAPLFRFEFQYSRMNVTDRDSLKAFFAARLGMDGLDWTAGFCTLTYNNLTFDDDAMEVQQQTNLIYDTILKFHQTQNLGYTIPSPGGAFPSFSWGGSLQLPFASVTQFLTAVGDSPSGPRYTYGFYGTGQTNYPTRGLKRWKVSLPVLADANVTTLENFFVGQQGRYGQFSFTDPMDSVTYTTVRFGEDVLELQYQGPNQTAATFTLVETNN